MGRNKGLNKLRKKNALDRNGASGYGKSRIAGGEKQHQSGESIGGENTHRSPLRKLLRLVATYPFVVIALAMGLPRVAPACMRWVRVRSGLFGPVVPVRWEKQVLIVGALGSGTAEMTTALNKLGVEVGHETSDSSNEPCRDGTVSWVHGIRFLSGAPNLSLLCGGPRRQAFASTMFSPSTECSYLFRSWSPCWANECRAVTAREYGCALRQQDKEVAAAAAAAAERERIESGSVTAGEGEEGAGGDSKAAKQAADGKGFESPRDEWDLDTTAAREWLDDQDRTMKSLWEEWEGPEGRHECGTPFRHNMLQVRHPLRSVALLVYKSASNKEAVGMDCRAGRQQVITISSLFPNKLVRTHERLGGRDAGSSENVFSNFDWARVATSCVQTWAWYWVVYNRAMMGEVDRWYRVEDTPPVKVAVMAGFSGVAIDEAVQASEQESASGQGPLLVRQSNSSMLGGWEVKWEDIAAYPGGLLREMSDLAVELGYEGAPWLRPDDTEGVDDNRSEGSGGGGGRKGWRGIFGRRKQTAK
eukprot:g9193.t1